MVCLGNDFKYIITLYFLTPGPIYDVYRTCMCRLAASVVATTSHTCAHVRTSRAVRAPLRPMARTRKAPLKRRLVIQLGRLCREANLYRLILEGATIRRTKWLLS
jgi:hypothetical protein